MLALMGLGSILYALALFGMAGEGVGGTKGTQHDA